MRIQSYKRVLVARKLLLFLDTIQDLELVNNIINLWIK
jgi:hypothetical protein